jgi:hypothetical protein
MGSTILLLLRRKSCYGIFITLKNPLSSTESKPARLGSSDKHANHYTTEVDYVRYYCR